MNFHSYSATAGYHLTQDLQPMLVVKGATAPSVYSGFLLEARGRLLWALSRTCSLDLFIARGISTSSPDYGVGLASIYSF